MTTSPWRTQQCSRLRRAGRMQLLLLGATAAAGANGASYAPGATAGKAWQCGWTTDRSALQVNGLGCAGAAPKSQKAQGAHASAAACEKWCCEAQHVKVGPPVPGGWEAQLAASGPPCDLWQWMDMGAASNGGCWVGVKAQSVPALQIGKENTAPTWIGAEGCIPPPAWGGHFLVFFGLLSAAYLGGGIVYGKHTVRAFVPCQCAGCCAPHSPCRSSLAAAGVPESRSTWTVLQGRGGGGSGRLGPLSAHPHGLLWLDVSSLVADGVAFARGGGRQRPGFRGSDQGPRSKGEKKPAETGGSSSSPGKAKKEKKERKKEKRGGSGTCEPLSSSSAQALAPTSAPAAVTGTAAGGGGRWVHQPD